MNLCYAVYYVCFHVLLAAYVSTKRESACKQLSAMTDENVCFEEEGNIILAGVYSFRQKQSESQVCSATINIEQAILSEVQRYSTRFFSGQPEWATVQFGNAFYDTCESETRIMQISKMITQTGYCQPDVNRYAPENATVDLDALAVITPAHSNLVQLLLWCSQQRCLPTVASDATASSLSDWDKYRYFHRTTSVDFFSSQAIIMLLFYQWWIWGVKVNVVYEDTVFGQEFKNNFESNRNILNTLLGSWATCMLCVDHYIDVNIDNWATLDDRIVNSPNVSLVIVTLATHQTSKAMLDHLWTTSPSVVKNHQFIFTSDVDLTRDKEMKEALVDTVLVLPHSHPMQCDDFTKFVYNTTIAERTNPWAVLALQQVNDCCWPSLPNKLYCDPASSYQNCTPDTSFAPLLHDQFYQLQALRRARRVFEAVNVVQTSLSAQMDSFCNPPNELCHNLTHQLSGPTLNDQMEDFINRHFFNRTSEYCQEGKYHKMYTHDLFILDGETWNPIGTYNYDWYHLRPDLNMSDEFDQKYRFNNHVDQGNMSAKGMCPWYRTPCPELNYVEDNPHFTPRFNETSYIYVDCRPNCVGPCYFNVHECNDSGAELNISYPNMRDSTTYNFRCPKGTDYFFQLNCWCHEITANYNYNYYFGFAHKARFTLPGISWMIMATTGIVVLLSLYVIVVIVYKRSTPIIRSIGLFTLLWEELSDLMIYASVMLMAINSNGMSCKLGPSFYCYTVALAFGSRVMHALVIADCPCYNNLQKKWNPHLPVETKHMLPVVFCLIILLLTYITSELTLFHHGLIQPVLNSSLLFNQRKPEFLSVCVLSPTLEVKRLVLFGIFPVVCQVATLILTTKAVKSKAPFQQFQARVMLIGWFSIIIIFFGTFAMLVGYNPHRTNPNILKNNTGPTCIAQESINWKDGYVDNSTGVPTKPTDAIDMMTHTCQKGIYDAMYSTDDLPITPLLQLSVLIVGMLLCSTTILPIIYMIHVHPQLNHENFVYHRRSPDMARRRKHVSGTAQLRVTDFPLDNLQHRQSARQSVPRARGDCF